MKRFIDLGLFVIVLIAGTACWMVYVGRSPNSPALPPAPTDKPILVAEPMVPALDRVPLVAVPDLSKVDRRLIEPPGLVRPRYCLLVFGSEATTRVWIVEDGEKLYVDRNANGDLTDDGEAITPTDPQGHRSIDEKGKNALHGEWTYSPGDLSPDDPAGSYTALKLIRCQDGSEPAQYLVSVVVGGVTWEYFGPLFADSRDAARVIHFGGPVLPKQLRGSTLRLRFGGEQQELHFGIGTPGLGSHSFAFVSCAGVPGDVRPVAEIAWPTQTGVLTERFVLVRRC